MPLDREALPFHWTLIQVKKCIPLRPRAWAEIKAMYICREKNRKGGREIMRKSDREKAMSFHLTGDLVLLSHIWQLYVSVIKKVPVSKWSHKKVLMLSTVINGLECTFHVGLCRHHCWAVKFSWLFHHKILVGQLSTRNGNFCQSLPLVSYKVMSFNNMQF